MGLLFSGERMKKPTAKILRAIRRIIDEQRNNLRKYRRGDSNVFLGRMFTLGNLFTYFIAEELFKHSKYTVLVDFPVKIPSRRQCIYPDIMIIRKGVLKGIIEVKYYLGWESKKGMKKMKNNYSSFFKATSFNYTIRDSKFEKKPKNTVKIPKMVKKILLVLQDSHNNSVMVKHSIKGTGFIFIILLNDREVDPRRPLNDFKVVKRDLYRQKNKIEQLFKTF